MSERRRHMVLSMFVHPAGYHNDAWRRPGTRAEEWGGLQLAVDLAQRAERAKLDAVFFADTTSAKPLLAGDTKVIGLYEPVTTLAALSSVTSHIGLIGTMSTSFNHPYNVARQFNGLDTLSGGRAGWNIVTSWMGNENYGLEAMPEAADRYRRAHEFVAVTKALWESWDEDAVIADRESGWWLDPKKLHAIGHAGEFFSVEGPLNMRRSPQAGPVLVQAGSSGPGIDLGATFAELIYTVQPVRQQAIDFYAAYKDIVESKGRAADDVSILPGILPIVGETEAEARELAHEFGEYVDLDRGRKGLERMWGISLEGVDYDDPVPAERLSAANTSAASTTSRSATFVSRTLDDGWSLKELIIEAARASGHHWFAGSVSQVADEMISWFDSRACDGFSLNAPDIPDGYRRICELLVPELQERGYFHDDYSGGTLRENIQAGRAQRVGTR